MTRALAKFIFVAISLVWAVLPAVGFSQEITRDPLRVPIVFPNDGLPTDPAEFQAWLMRRAENLGEEELTLVREHLYALISADAKRRFESLGDPYPRSADPDLAEQFAWANDLGIIGAALVARALDPETRAVDPQGTLGPGLALFFKRPSFRLIAEEDGWGIEFPHYFMIGLADRQKLDNGLENSLLILSTLFAANSPEVGSASQATIMVASAQTDDVPGYAAFWLVRFDIEPTEAAPNTVPNAVRTYRSYDEDSHLWKEMVVFNIPSGALVAFYSGLKGTYEANRQDFVDFLETLRVRQGD
ncbi:MAG: hypothetical protein ABFS14_04330 [Gemmatimonadota bacterium]